MAFDGSVVDLIAGEAERLGVASVRMPSGAGHDAQMLARICPAGMIFVPSIGGLSHNVLEDTAPADIVRGAQLLLQVLLKLADRPS